MLSLYNTEMEIIQEYGIFPLQKKKKGKKGFWKTIVNKSHQKEIMYPKETN